MGVVKGTSTNYVLRGWGGGQRYDYDRGGGGGIKPNSDVTGPRTAFHCVQAAQVGIGVVDSQIQSVAEKRAVSSFL
jgi:hypothetical protein